MGRTRAVLSAKGYPRCRPVPTGTGGVAKSLLIGKDDGDQRQLNRFCPRRFCHSNWQRIGPNMPISNVVAVSYSRHLRCCEKVMDARRGALARAIPCQAAQRSRRAFSQQPFGTDRFGRIPLSRAACSGRHCGAPRFAGCIPNRPRRRRENSATGSKRHLLETADGKVTPVFIIIVTARPVLTLRQAPQLPRSRRFLCFATVSETWEIISEAARMM